MSCHYVICHATMSYVMLLCYMSCHYVIWHATMSYVMPLYIDIHNIYSITCLSVSSKIYTQLDLRLASQSNILCSLTIIFLSKHQTAFNITQHLKRIFSGNECRGLNRPELDRNVQAEFDRNAPLLSLTLKGHNNALRSNSTYKFRSNSDRFSLLLHCSIGTNACYNYQKMMVWCMQNNGFSFLRFIISLDSQHLFFFLVWMRYYVHFCFDTQC